MPTQLTDWLSPATLGSICAAAGVAVTKVFEWLNARRKAANDSNSEFVKLSQANQQAVVQQLFEVVKTLRTDLTELRNELEESEERRVKAEDTVRKLRDEVHSLRNELQRRGFAAPAPV